MLRGLKIKLPGSLVEATRGGSEEKVDEDEGEAVMSIEGAPALAADR